MSYNVAKSKVMRHVTHTFRVHATCEGKKNLESHIHVHTDERSEAEQVCQVPTLGHAAMM